MLAIFVDNDTVASYELYHSEKKEMHMNTKKLIFATLSALSVASLFADDFRFTETAGQFGKYNTNPKQYITGYYLTGTGGVNTGSVDSITTNPSDGPLVLENITLNFTPTDSKNLVISGAGQVASGDYALGTKGTSVINFQNGATVGMTLKNGFSASYGETANFTGNLTVNVDSGYLGTIVSDAIAGQFGVVTLNLNKANAISVSSSSYTKLVRLFVNDARGQFNLNMSANQTVDLDIRSNIKGVFNLSITDGASLFVNGATGYLPDTVKEGFITLVNGNIDGTVYFLENIVTSDGFADGTITITHASKSQMISFIDSDGNKMGDDRLKFGTTTSPRRFPNPPNGRQSSGQSPSDWRFAAGENSRSHFGGALSSADFFCPHAADSRRGRFFVGFACAFAL